MKIFSIASYRFWLAGLAVIAGGVWLCVHWLVLQDGYLTRFCGQDLDIFCTHYWGGVFYDFHHGFLLKSVIISALILMLLPERAFRWWRWFAVVAIPLFAWSLTKQLPAYSDAIELNIEGEVFLSLSIVLATLSLLFGKINDHHFSKPFHRYGAYLGALALSLLIGFLLLWGILWALN